jgi:hypothetical protein
MIRKRFRRRPEFDSLETMVLLSGISVVEHTGVAALVAPVAKSGGSKSTTTPIVLSGTAKGTFQTGRGAGAPTSFNAKGVITPLGHATLKGSIQPALFAQISRQHIPITVGTGKGVPSNSPAHPTGTVTLAVRKHGKVFASLSTQGSGSPVFYRITGATGTYTNVSGSGEAIITTTGSSHGKLTITFENLTG